MVQDIQSPFTNRSSIRLLCSPLQIASQDKGNVEMVRLLLFNGAKVNDGPKEIRPLTLAIETGDFEMVKELLNHGAEIDEEALNKNLSIMAKRAYNKAEVTERKKIDALLKLKLEMINNVREG